MMNRRGFFKTLASVVVAAGIIKIHPDRQAVLKRESTTLYLNYTLKEPETGDLFYVTTPPGTLYRYDGEKWIIFEELDHAENL